MSNYFKLSDVIDDCELALSAVNAAEDEYVHNAAVLVAKRTGQCLSMCESCVRDSMREHGSEFRELRLHVKGFRNGLHKRKRIISLSPEQVRIYEGIRRVSGYEQSTA